MRYHKCGLVCGLMVASLMMTAVTGCGADSSQSAQTEVEGTEAEKTVSENTFAYTDGTEEELISTTLMGKVGSISGNEVTLSIGGFGGGAPNGGAPDGEAPSGEAPDGETPGGEAPDGEAPNGEAPAGGASGGASSDGETSGGGATGGEAPTGEAPNGEMPGEMETGSGVLTVVDESVILVTGQDGTTLEGTLADITEGAMLQITFDENGVITAITVSSGMEDTTMGQGMPGGQSNGVENYEAVVEYAEDSEVEGETFSSTGTDENAILVSNGSRVILKEITVDRTSLDSTGGDNASFYGVGAAVLATDGTTYISDADITTDAAGGAGVFSYKEGSLYISDSTIKTKQNTSGGIHVAGGGTLYAWDLNVETDGESAAAIRSDRGGGTMIVNGGDYTSNGVGSPAVYCTADIAVNNAKLTANGSEAICMEGLNTIHLFDCDITGNMSDLEVNDTTWNIIVYQSMSGDSEVGNSTMQIIGGTLTSENGGMIYTTNTECNILLSDVDITYADDSEFFLMCTGNNNERGWGSTGKNGSNCVFTADEQKMEGDVVWDSISTLDFYLTNGSSLNGAVLDDETYAGNGGDGYCNIYISKDSVWTVTGDSTVTNLYNEGTIVDANGKTVRIVGTDGAVYEEGNSSYTITVENYAQTADLSGAATTAEWSDYEVEKPQELC